MREFIDFALKTVFKLNYPSLFEVYYTKWAEEKVYLFKSNTFGCGTAIDETNHLYSKFYNIRNKHRVGRHQTCEKSRVQEGEISQPRTQKSCGKFPTWDDMYYEFHERRGDDSWWWCEAVSRFGTKLKNFQMWKNEDDIEHWALHDEVYNSFYSI